MLLWIFSSLTHISFDWIVIPWGKSHILHILLFPVIVSRAPRHSMGVHNDFWELVRYCYELNVFVPPKSMCLSLNPQCAGIWRWGLWEVIRFKWGHESRPPWWDWCLSKEIKRSELFPQYMRIHQESSPLRTRKRALTRTQRSWTSTLLNCEK